MLEFVPVELRLGESVAAVTSLVRGSFIRSLFFVGRSNGLGVTDCYATDVYDRSPNQIEMASL